MDSELVTGSLSGDPGGGSGGRPPVFSYANFFDKMCPQYMAMGLSYEDFWYGDPEKAKFVREAFVYSQEVRNREMWIMGRYVYDAIFANSPVLRAFSSASSPNSYTSEPYPITNRTLKEYKDKKEYEEQMRVQADAMAQIEAANRAIRERMKNGGTAGP